MSAVLSRLKRHKVGAVVALMIAVRVVFLIAFAPLLDFTAAGDAIHGSDAYDAYARNLLSEGVYGREPGQPDAMIPPLYSYMLAGTYAIFGRTLAAIGLLHITLDVLSLLLLIDIGRRLFPQQKLWGDAVGDWVGVLAGVFYALYPYLIFQNLTLIDTPLWIFWLHLFVWLLILLRERPRLDMATWGVAILAGLVLGLSLLTRPIMPVLALMAALWFLLRLNLWQSFIRLLPVALVGALVLVPWIARNTALFDAFVPMTTTSGANLWQGNNAMTVPVFRAGYDVQWLAPETIAPRQTREADAERFQLVIDYWRENPQALPELFWVKFLIHWSVEITPRRNPQPNEQFALSEDGQLLIVQGDASISGVNAANIAYDSGLLDTLGRPVHVIYFGGLLVLAVIGFVLSLRLWRSVSLLWFVQISMTLIYVLFHPSTRYRAPSDPLLFLLSAYALVALAQYWQARRKRPIETVRP